MSKVVIEVDPELMDASFWTRELGATMREWLELLNKHGEVTLKKNEHIHYDDVICKESNHKECVEPDDCISHRVIVSEET